MNSKVEVPALQAIDQRQGGKGWPDEVAVKEWRNACMQAVELPNSDCALVCKTISEEKCVT